MADHLKLCIRVYAAESFEGIWVDWKVCVPGQRMQRSDILEDLNERRINLGMEEAIVRDGSNSQVSDMICNWIFSVCQSLQDVQAYRFLDTRRGIGV